MAHSVDDLIDLSHLFLQFCFDHRIQMSMFYNLVDYQDVFVVFC